jgi:hypothetical protein
MNKNTKLRDLVKKMIAESKISERISHIEEAGNTAANEAKLTRIGEELDKANKISQVLEKINLEHYIGEKLYSKVKEEMAKSIQEYEDAKTELEEKAASKETAMKDVKDDKKKDEKGKEKVLESKSKKLNETTNIIGGNFNKKINQFVKDNNLYIKHSTDQDHSDSKDLDLYVNISTYKDGTHPIAKFFYKKGTLEYSKDGEFANMVKKFDFS